jgi:hypothetical protein
VFLDIDQPRHHAVNRDHGRSASSKSSVAEYDEVAEGSAKWQLFI